MMAERQRFATGLAEVTMDRAACNSRAARSELDIEQFMQGYKAAWEGRDEALFCALFAPDATYRNTPFAEQRGHEQLARYWQRVKLQDDIHLSYEILASPPGSGIAHWQVTYQVTSDELFRIWAASTGTNVVARHADDPLPRMVLDGVLRARFAEGLCSECRLWWHSIASP
jgi:SnoaL-like domain